MHGGHGGRLFFYGQVTEFAKQLINELPQAEYSNEEKEAGFEEIAEAFGFYATLDNIARYVGQDDDIVIKWPLGKFYTKLKLLAWRADATKKYREIMDRKNKT